MLNPPLELNNDFNYVLDKAENSKESLFITGRAGTGKSTLLRLFRTTTEKKTVVLAPTGIAALNVKGQTIHSFFKLPPKPLTAEEIFKRRKVKLLQKVEVIIIDEISMVRADLLDNIDLLLRVNRDSDEPFGGVQMIFFGDLFQLPPVVSSEAETQLFDQFYETPYFFSAKAFDDGFELDFIELQKVYRQDSRHFLRLLEAVRMNRLDMDDLDDLNERYIDNFKSDDFYITLSARNATVNRLNQQKLMDIPLETEIYEAKVTGQFPEKLYPTERMLGLKLNAQVMFIKNDPEKRFVNGTIGKVVKLEEKKITILVEEDERERYVVLEEMDWEIVRYEIDKDNPQKIVEKTLGTFTQFPIKLAWAMTIHKSQGKTFEKVIIDLGKGGAFAFGQTYVALSRCRTLEGIVLKTPLRQQDIKTDPKVVEFYQRFF